MTFARFAVVAGLCFVALGLGVASAQSAPQEAKRSEAEFLVAPQGGAFEVPLHAGEVCILSFPERLSNKALTSSPDFELKSWGDDGVAVRAIGSAAKTTTLALATNSGAIKVNVTLTVVHADKPGFTLVRFKAVTAEEAFAGQLREAVARELAPLKAEVEKQRQELERQRQLLDKQIRDRAEDLIATRLVKRNETVAFRAAERNDDHVVVRVIRGALIGDEGYIVFEIENRSKDPYRLTGVRVRTGERDVQGPAQLTSASVTRDPGGVGIVPAGANVRGVVMVRAVDQILGKNLSVTVTGPPGSQSIQIERGIMFR